MDEKPNRPLNPNPLHNLHQQTEAEFQPYGDVEIVSTFGNVPAEYSSIHKGSGKMDLPQRGILEVTGTDRLDFLNRMLSNQVGNLTSGHGTYAFFLNLKGRIVADMIVLELTDRTWLEMDARLVQPTLEALKKFVIVESVTLRNCIGEIYSIGLLGPQAGAELILPDLGQLDSAQFKFAGVDTIVWRDDRCGSAGHYFSFPMEEAEKIWTNLTLRPIGWAAFNAARVEAGRPMMGIDFDESVLPAETGAETLARAVSFTKGCYLGQEIVARMHARGQAARQLVGIRMDGDSLPVAGSPIYDEQANVIGGVTSSTVSPILSNAAICLGYVKKQFVTVGTEVTIPAEGSMCKGKVAEVPFAGAQ